MQSPDTAGANGRPASPARRVGARSELEQLRATCRSQALTIDALGEAVSGLRREAAAPTADNAEPRAGRDRVGSGGRRGRARASGRLDASAAFAVRPPCDARAPGTARILVAHGLRDRVAAGALDSAQLLISELVTNSARHSGAGRVDAVRVRVSPSRTLVVLEVEDAGRGGEIAPRPQTSTTAASACSSCRHSASAGARARRPRPHDRLGAAAAHAPARAGRQRRARRGPRATVSHLDQPAGRRPPSAARRRTAMTELHVTCDERTTWRVFEDGAAAPLSEHTNATDAERAALARAEDRDVQRVVVHDRYHRTHDAAPSQSRLRTRAQRARQLALARELVRSRTP
jgi:hypothetical protein